MHLSLPPEPERGPAPGEMRTGRAAPGPARPHRRTDGPAPAHGHIPASCTAPQLPYCTAELAAHRAVAPPPHAPEPEVN
ncbi:hypothetical protein OG422_21620 [Streptomyces sp. NBC_01525]|uniref:hypothetical protein n=1 Tax=Streptomyces sp. NBC_01525 TaxID=2903893 RepID=UPI003870D655